MAFGNNKEINKVTNSNKNLFTTMFAQQGGYTIVLLDSSSYAWAYPKAGDNTDISRAQPTSVAGGKQWRKFAISFDTTSMVVGLDASGFAWAWGVNGSGQLGDGTIATRSSPVSVVGDRVFIDIVVATSSVYALDTSSYMWAWGNNSSGQLGDNTTTNKSSPISVLGGQQWLPFTNRLLSGGVVFLNISSYAWAWGNNNNGRLGDNTVTNRSSPVSVVGGKTWSNIRLHPSANVTFGIDISSFIWAWGANTYGSLGDNTVTNRSSPVSCRNQSGLSFVDVAPGYTVLAVDSSSFLWSWGTPATGAGTNKSVVTMLANIKVKPDSIDSIIYGTGAVCTAIREDGALLTWGPNFGSYGNDTTTSNATPYNKANASISFQKRVAHNAASGVSFNVALSSSSTLWTWGASAYNGQYLDNISYPLELPVRKLGVSVSGK